MNNLNNIINSFSEYVFWKDLNFIYQGGNTNFLKILGLNTISDLAGRSDYDFDWDVKQAKIHRESDLCVLNGVSVINSIQFRWHKNGMQPIIINKIPLRNNENEIIGILSTHKNIITDKLGEQENLSSPLSKDLVNSIKDLLDIEITYREIECLSLWLSGYSLKESSTILKISERTVEVHRRNISDKIGIYRKNHLIDYVREKGILNLFMGLSNLLKK
ncbi:MAG: putative aerobic respiration control sensor protein arcB [Francisellaceae bacterium]|nr:putative aerobic respiration control sensor protein arcB [Francisellaceae bacterium]